MLSSTERDTDDKCCNNAKTELYGEYGEREFFAKMFSFGFQKYFPKLKTELSFRRIFSLFAIQIQNLFY